MGPIVLRREALRDTSKRKEYGGLLWKVWGLSALQIYAVLSFHIATDVKPGIINRRNLGSIYLNEFVHGKVRLLKGGGGLFVLPPVDSWLVGVYH
jgi:hypothetical protein